MAAAMKKPKRAMTNLSLAESEVNEDEFLRLTNQDSRYTSERSVITKASKRPDDDVTRGQVLMVYTMLGVFAVWSFVVLLDIHFLTIFYAGPGIAEISERYAVAAAKRIGVEASRELAAVFVAKDALAYAIDRKSYFNPLDVQAVRRVLEPTFVAWPGLSAIDLAFTTYNDSIRLIRTVGDLVLNPGDQQGPTPVTLLLQSGAPDCLELLGRLGCLRVPRAHTSTWYSVGVNLFAGAEAALYESGGVSAGYAGPTEQWLESSVFVTHGSDRVGKAARRVADAWIDYGPNRPDKNEAGYARDGASVSFEKALMLVFKLAFPGTRGGSSVVGRATLRLTSLLDAGVLSDAAAGNVVEALFCTRAGEVLASMKPGGHSIVDQATGRVRTRLAWEASFYPWARFLSADFLRSPPNVKRIDGYALAVEPVLGRGMDSFVVVVAAARGSFVDSFLMSVATGACVLLWVPLPVGLSVQLANWAFARYKRAKALVRVHPFGGWGRSDVAQKP